MLIDMNDVERYAHIQSVVQRFFYGGLGKCDKGVVRAYSISILIVR